MHAFGNFFERETPAPQCQRLFDGIAHRITSSSVNSMTGRLFSWWVLFSIMVCSLLNARRPCSICLTDTVTHITAKPKRWPILATTD